MDPYLPDIIQSIVQRVSGILNAKAVNPFAVFFDKGNHNQVSKSVYAKNTFPLVWLKMPFTVKRGNPLVFGEVYCDLILAMPTDSTYTQQQRDDNVYKPRLLPLYAELMVQIQKEKMFSFKGHGHIEHNQLIHPYWGGGTIEGTNGKNLFEREIDAIGIMNLKLTIKNNC
jgi:hypothetical protein